MAKTTRARLDELLVERGLAATRSAARGLIMAGLVLVEGQMSDKAGTLVPLDALVQLKKRPRFVSRAGDKLAHALEVFGLDVGGVSALDVGASTGGFGDCLLQAGATRVIALDVGRGQLDGRLRNDPRVYALDKVNARHLSPELLPYVPDFLTMDVSFISVSKVLPAVIDCMAPVYRGVILIKPQFEAGPRQVGKGGVVRDPQVHRGVLLALGRLVIEEMDARLVGLTDSGLLGADGNREFFFKLSRGGEKGWGLDTLEEAVDSIVGHEAEDDDCAGKAARQK
jgi:23S rRNA (cytidine1920-2'-O)/16S rRNA (cytidine1409-2'-O)-methyltransferase